MAKSPNTASKSKAAPKAQPEVHAPEAATKMLDDGMEKFTDMATKFGSFAEDSMKTATERAAASTEVMRTLSTRNMDFFQGSPQSHGNPVRLCKIPDVRLYFGIERAG